MQVSKARKGYKLVDTGFGKFEEIPEEWEIIKFGDVISRNQLGTSKTGVVNGEGVPLIKMGNLTFGGFNFKKLEKIQLSEIENAESFILKKNDFLFNTRNSDVLVGKSSVWKNNFPIAIFNNNLMRIEFTDKIKNPDYVSYFINSFKGRKNLKRIIDQTTNVAAIYYYQLKKLKFVLPSLNEQQRITSILTNIDNTLEKTNQLIEKIELLKKGMMKELFTKGIGHTKFKKVEWFFGDQIEIPQKWSIQILDNLTPKKIKGSIRLGPFGSSLKKHELLNSGEIKTLWIENIIDNEFSWDYKKFISKEKFKELKNFTVKPYDILITMMGTLGKVAIVPQDIGTAIISSHLLKISLDKEKVLSEYLFHFLQSNIIYKQIQNEARGVIMGGLNTTIIKNILILVPEIKEQKQIATILSNVDSQITKEKLQKSNLEILKKGLIQKLLTGQIRVTV